MADALLNEAALLLGSVGEAKFESDSYRIIDFDINGDELADESDAERNCEPRPVTVTAKSVRFAMEIRKIKLKQFCHKIYFFATQKLKHS